MFAVFFSCLICVSQHETRKHSHDHLMTEVHDILVLEMSQSQLEMKMRFLGNNQDEEWMFSKRLTFI